MSDTPPALITPPVVAIKPSVRDKVESFCVEFVAFALWTYAMVKLFVFDFDIYLVKKYAPEYSWLLNYKLLLMFFVIAGVFAIKRKAIVLLWAIFIIFYPLFILCWRIPKSLFKNRSYILGLSIINWVCNLVMHARYIAITTTLYSFLFVFALSTHVHQLLWLVVGGLPLLLLVSYMRRVLLVLRPVSLFSFYKKVLRKISDQVEAKFRPDDSLAGLEVTKYNDQQLAAWTMNLGYNVLHNRACLFLSKKLRTYQNSGIEIITSVFIIFGLFIVTVVSFCLINFALFKINPASFAVTQPPTLFTFLYYSFKAILFSSIPKLSPVSNLSQSFEMIENFFELFLVAIFASVIIPARNQKYSREIDDIVATFEQEGRNMEASIKRHFSIETVDDAIRELQRLKFGLLDLIVFLSK